MYAYPHAYVPAPKCMKVDAVLRLPGSYNGAELVLKENDLYMVMSSIITACIPTAHLPLKQPGRDCLEADQEM